MSNNGDFNVDTKYEYCSPTVIIYVNAKYPRPSVKFEFKNKDEAIEWFSKQIDCVEGRTDNEPFIMGYSFRNKTFYGWEESEIE